MTLRIGTPEEIGDMFRRLNSDREQIIESVIQLVYYMRGAIQYRDMLDMSMMERQAVSTFITKRLKDESGKMYPQY